MPNAKAPTIGLVNSRTRIVKGTRIQNTRTISLPARTRATAARLSLSLSGSQGIRCSSISPSNSPKTLRCVPCFRPQWGHTSFQLPAKLVQRVFGELMVVFVVRKPNSFGWPAQISVSCRPRERTHDAQVYRAYQKAADCLATKDAAAIGEIVALEWIDFDCERQPISVRPYRPTCKWDRAQLGSDVRKRTSHLTCRYRLISLDSRTPCSRSGWHS